MNLSIRRFFSTAVLMSTLAAASVAPVHAGGKFSGGFRACVAEAQTQQDRSECHWQYQSNGRGR